MYQTVIIAGYLGRDPEMRYLPSGQPVTNFSVATSRKWTNQDGSPGEETTWWKVSVWGKSAEACNKYISKGQRVLIEGRMSPDPDTGGPKIWIGHDGNPRASFELVASTVKFIGGDEVKLSGVDDSAEVLPESDDIPF